jgi:hypothetical protein
MLFPHKRIYMPTITNADPAILLIVDRDTLGAME